MLEAAGNELDACLARLEQHCDNLVWAVEAQPSRRLDHAVVDHFEQAAADMAVAVKEARAALAAVWPADERAEVTNMRRALAACHVCCNRAWGCFYRELASYEWRRALQELHPRGRAHASWATGVDDALAPCQQPIDDVSRALLACWEALVEHAGRISITAHATGISAEQLTLAPAHSGARKAKQAGSGA
jgi:hypothetical protein